MEKPGLYSRVTDPLGSVGRKVTGPGWHFGALILVAGWKARYVGGGAQLEAGRPRGRILEANKGMTVA